jgi:hypothetical protein
MNDGVMIDSLPDGLSGDEVAELMGGADGSSWCGLWCAVRRYQLIRR